MTDSKLTAGYLLAPNDGPKMEVNPTFVQPERKSKTPWYKQKTIGEALGMGDFMVRQLEKQASQSDARSDKMARKLGRGGKRSVKAERRADALRNQADQIRDR